MKLAELLIIIDGTVFNSNQNLEMEIKGGCGADLMSDVLASVQPDAVLLTGLCNPQVVRTAQDGRRASHHFCSWKAAK
jgi:hypothetical protein